MLLFSFLWLNATGHPKPSSKPTIKIFQAPATAPATAPAALSSLSDNLGQKYVTPVKTPPQVPPGNKTPAPKPFSKQAPAKKKPHPTSPLEKSEPYCSCCCGSKSSGPSSISSNTPDDPDDQNDFYKPNDHIQNALLELARAFPSTFKTLEQAGLVRHKIDEQGFYYEINCKWAELEAEFTTKMDKSQSNSKWFTIAGVVGSLLALGGSLYLSLGEDFLAGLILGLGSTAISIVTSALDYIKAGTVDYAKRAMEKVTSACSYVRSMLPSYFDQVLNNFTAEDEEAAQSDLEKTMTIMKQIKPNEDKCCNSECCNCECDSALGKLHKCFCCEQDIDYEKIEKSTPTLEAIRQKLEENEKWWSSALEKMRALSLVSGVVAPVFNAGSSTLFLTTSLTKPTKLPPCWNTSDSFVNSSAAVNAAFEGIKFTNLGLSVADVLIKVGLYIVQSKIDRINAEQTKFTEFVENLIESVAQQPDQPVQKQFLQDLLQLSGRGLKESSRVFASTTEAVTTRRKAA